MNTMIDDTDAAARSTLSAVAGTNFGFLWTDPLDAGLDRIAAAGVTHVELMVSLPHVDLRRDTDQLASEIATANGQSGLEVTSLNPVDLNLISASPGIAEASLRQLLLTLDLAEAIGAPTVVVVPGKYSALNPMDERVALDMFHRGVDKLLTHASHSGVSLAFENVPFGFLQSPRRLWQELEPLHSRFVGLTVDVANVHFIDGDVAAEIAAVRDHIMLVHVSDTDQTRFSHAHVGDGTLDFAAAADALRRVGYAGTSVYELATPGVDWPRWRKDLERLRSYGWAGAAPRRPSHAALS